MLSGQNCALSASQSYPASALHRKQDWLATVIVVDGDERGVQAANAFDEASLATNLDDVALSEGLGNYARIK